MEFFENPYRSSLLVERMRKGPHVGIYDLDNTLTGCKASQIRAHELIHSKGPFVINTARETGMVMASKALRDSRKYGYTRAPPNLKKDEATDRYSYVPPEHLDRFAGLLNPTAIIGFGGGILLRQQEPGYAVDHVFADSLGGAEFRPRMLTHLKSIDLGGDVIGALSLLENDTAFLEGRTDVEPLFWRIQINPKDEAQKTDLKFRIASHLLAVGEYATVDIVDESRPTDGVFTIYLVPRTGTKEASADHLLRSALTESGVSARDLHLTLADDAFTGLRMLTDVLPGAHATFVLPGNAPVARHLMEASSQYGKRFAGEDVSWLLERLTKTDVAGVYHCFMPGEMPNRRFIIADEVVAGNVAVDSILALNERGLLYTG